LISVDLPAPFSPASTCTSPPQHSKSTPVRTGTAPNRLPMPRMRSIGAGASMGLISSRGADKLLPYNDRRGLAHCIARR
jgi:hypothetical protein